jgi:hypothetical protein
MNKNWRCELAINGEVWDAELVYSRRERQRKLPHREDEGMEERGVRQQRVWTDPVTYTLTTVSSGSRQVSHPTQPLCRPGHAMWNSGPPRL